jgi:hypothetical protein
MECTSCESETLYTDEPMELGQVVKDFLPPPDQLVPKGKTYKIAIALIRVC